MTLDGPSDLARMMQKVNRLAYEASANNRYATFFFATYKPDMRELRYLNAGHNPPVLIRAGGEDVPAVRSGRTGSGLLPFGNYEEQLIVLEPGDL
jgi:phosphoserine phosphatase RsbU/P